MENRDIVILGVIIIVSAIFLFGALNKNSFGKKEISGDITFNLFSECSNPYDMADDTDTIECAAQYQIERQRCIDRENRCYQRVPQHRRDLCEKQRRCCTTKAFINYYLCTGEYQCANYIVNYYNSIGCAAFEDT